MKPLQQLGEDMATRVDVERNFRDVIDRKDA